MLGALGTQLTVFTIAFGAISFLETSAYYAMPRALTLAGERGLLFGVAMSLGTIAAHLVRVKRTLGLSADSLRSVHRADVVLPGPVDGAALRESMRPVPWVRGVTAVGAGQFRVDAGFRWSVQRTIGVTVDGSRVTVEVRARHPLLFPASGPGRRIFDQLRDALSARNPRP
ncbi:hypothetical protein P2Q00_15025 [Streptomyces coacervatus]|uniref:hypothetical protein n=1 Tax=Streptomyces coacervatus TaxID=647381 RepID=UPI0023DC9F80|nr:hypothetical protein [Streptomyces coacervatus]MDF2266729.1 hypothetical protein [Streptomyces coacervatus]